MRIIFSIFSFFFSTVIMLSSCDTKSHQDINIILTDFTEELLDAFIGSGNERSKPDSMNCFVITCYDNCFNMFEYDGFSRRDLVGKAMSNGLLVKVYGDENPIVYNRLHKTQEKETFDTDGNYVEDLRMFSICCTPDKITLDYTDWEDVITIRDICRRYFPSKKIVWHTTSFILDDIQL